MVRSLTATVLLAAVVCGVAAAGEFNCLITKVEDGKVTFRKYKGGDPQSFTDAVRNGKEETLPASGKVKVFYAKLIPKAAPGRGDVEIPDGLNNERIKNVGKGGNRDQMFSATLITDDSGKTITEAHIYVPQRRPSDKDAKKDQ